MCKTNFTPRVNEIKSLINDIDQDLDFAIRIGGCSREASHGVRERLAESFEKAEKELTDNIERDEFKLIIEISLNIFSNHDLEKIDIGDIKLSKSGLKLLLRTIFLFSINKKRFNYKTILDSDLNASN